MALGTAMQYIASLIGGSPAAASSESAQGGQCTDSRNLRKGRHSIQQPQPASHASGSVEGALAVLGMAASHSGVAPSSLSLALGRPHASCAEAAAHNKRQIAEAAEEHSRKKVLQKPAYSWPSLRKGQSDEQASLQAEASYRRLMQEQDPARGSAQVLKVASPSQFLQLKSSSQVDELPPVARHADDSNSPLEAPYVYSSDGSLRDENGERVQWPWSTDTSPASSSNPQDRFIQPIFSARHARQKHSLDDLVELALDHASSDRLRGRTHVGVRAWFAFCEDVMGTSANRPMDPLATPLWAKLEDEWLAMRFVCALVQERGITPNSAYQYFCMVQGWHGREHGVKLAGGLKLERLPQMLKGLKRIVGAVPRPLRRGVTPANLKAAMDAMLDPRDPTHANLRAALATALQGLLRSAEYAAKGGKVDKFTLMRADIVSLNKLRMVLMMHPCKNMHHLSGKTCPLVIGGGGACVDAVAEMLNLFSVDPHSDPHSTPLFREPKTGKPISYATVNSLVKEMMLRVEGSSEGFSTHSLRIGGATALFAAGASETVIRTMGRWSSDIHRLYVRACFEQCCDWTRLAGSQQVSCVAVEEFDEVDDY